MLGDVSFDGGDLIGFGGTAVTFFVLVRVFIWQQIKDLRAHIERLEEKVERLEGREDEQRRLKHAAINQLARAQFAVSVIRDLMARCSCDAFEQVRDVIDSLAEGTTAASNAAMEREA